MQKELIYFVDPCVPGAGAFHRSSSRLVRPLLTKSPYVLFWVDSFPARRGI